MDVEMAVIKRLSGQVWLRNDEGGLMPLREGMHVPLNSAIVTEEDGSLDMSLAFASPISIGGGREFFYSREVEQRDPDPESAALGSGGDREVLRLLTALLEELPVPFSMAGDPSQAYPATGLLDGWEEGRSALVRAGSGLMINLEDILKDEPSNIVDFLHVEQDGLRTVLKVSNSGQFSEGYAPGKVDHEIVLEGAQMVDISDELSTLQSIRDMISAGKLKLSE